MNHTVGATARGRDIVDKDGVAVGAAYGWESGGPTEVALANAAAWAGASDMLASLRSLKNNGLLICYPSDSEVVIAAKRNALAAIEKATIPAQSKVPA